mmetsp:Transcript_33085/g.67681  ORF Transcript_33085/g.67681 Transcript_33085/m.67681 type:complete len:372 (+) Transcript_33085:311-1426(+)
MLPSPKTRPQGYQGWGFVNCFNATSSHTVVPASSPPTGEQGNDNDDDEDVDDPVDGKARPPLPPLLPTSVLKASQTFCVCAGGMVGKPREVASSKNTPSKGFSRLPMQPLATTTTADSAPEETAEAAVVFLRDQTSSHQLASRAENVNLLRTSTHRPLADLPPAPPPSRRLTGSNKRFTSATAGCMVRSASTRPFMQKGPSLKTPPPSPKSPPKPQSQRARRRLLRRRRPSSLASNTVATPPPLRAPSEQASPPASASSWSNAWRRRGGDEDGASSVGNGGFASLLNPWSHQSHMNPPWHDGKLGSSNALTYTCSPPVELPMACAYSHKITGLSPLLAWPRITPGEAYMGHTTSVSLEHPSPSKGDPPPSY